MAHSCIKAGAALLLGGFAFAGPALAAPSLSFDGTAPLVILAGDEENQEVWQDLRPDVTPPEAAVGKEGEAPKDLAERPKGEAEGGGNIEEKELQEDGLEPK